MRFLVFFPLSRSMFVLIFLLFTNGILQQESDAAPLPDWSDFSQNVFEGLATLSEHGKAVRNFTSSQWETIKNNTHVQNTVEGGKNWSLKIWESAKYYFREIRSYLPDWAWIIIGVILIIWCIQSEDLKECLKCCGCLWCCGFHKRGVAAHSCASMWQSCCYGGHVKAGSCFSCCQSMAMK